MSEHGQLNVGDNVKLKDTIYANRLDLDKLNVFLEGSGDDPMFLEVESLPNILTYGKH